MPSGEEKLSVWPEIKDLEHCLENKGRNRERGQACGLAISRC